MVPLCRTPTHPTQNGDVLPVFCHGGAINVTVWMIYTHVKPGLMQLGRSATLQQVDAAICVAHPGATTGQQESIYAMASAYNGWHFGSEPVKHFLAGQCQET